MKFQENIAKQLLHAKKIFINDEEQTFVFERLKDICGVEVKDTIDYLFVADEERLRSQYTNDFNNGIAIVEACIEQGNHSAEYILGDLICQGQLPKYSVEEGLSLLVKSAVSGNPIAQYKLGQIHDDGFYITQHGHEISLDREDLSDRRLSAFWTYTAAVNGHPKAQYWYVDNLRIGHYDVYPEMDNELIDMVRKSAKQGYQKAISFLKRSNL